MSSSPLPPGKGSSPRGRGDAGIVLILWTVLLTGLLIMVAIAIDLEHARSSAALDQSVVDLSALAGGKNLANGNFEGACTDAIDNLNLNVPGLPAISASSFCSQPGNDVTQTVCSSGGGLVEAEPSVTEGAFTVTIHFPVPDAEIRDPKYGVGRKDGTPCQRMRVIVTNTEPVFFSGIVGNKGLSVTRSATVRGSVGTTKVVPAMWLLDPFGCGPSLTVNGNGGNVTVGDITKIPPVPGLIAVDSDGTGKGCNGNTDTVTVNGGATLQAVPTSGSSAGSIDLFALNPGATTCSDGNNACNQSDVINGYLTPQPAAALQRATRAPADWRYNCKTGYPDYHGIGIADCPDSLTTEPYIDELVATIGTKNAPDSSYQRWSVAEKQIGGCSPTKPITVSGNWWVDCPALTVSGVPVTFTDGNVVLDGDLTVGTKGEVHFNDSNATAHLPAGCLTSVTPNCIDDSSADAAFVYLRGGTLTTQGGSDGGLLTANHTMIYQVAGSKVTVNMSSTNPGMSWTAPDGGPFAKLALWSESSAKYKVTGGGTAKLTGTFFTPEAVPFTLAGNGDWSQSQDAQFISFQAVVTGNGKLTMVPDPTLLSIPPTSGFLIR
jgi:hypothetical protein